MIPKLEKIPFQFLSSFAVKKEITPYMDYPWHYHPEFEIIFIEKSYGIRLMGNHIGNFRDGDLMFIGPNLPHVWRNDTDFYRNNKNLKVVVYVIHFREDAFGERFFNLPEFASLHKLFSVGQQGILIKGKNHKKISGLIKKVYASSGIKRFTLFLKTLEAISNNQEYDLLSSPGYIKPVNDSDTQRINRVVNFMLDNYSKDIRVDEAADLIHMNKASFCRYFKSRTHKTFTQFLNQIRIAYACKLLVSSNMNASQICYEIGYNNISHFNRQFKLYVGMSAMAYTKNYLESAGSKFASN